MVFIGILAIVLMVAWLLTELQQQPVGWLSLVLFAVFAVAIWRLLRKQRIERKMGHMGKLADQLEAVVRDFGGIDTYLALRKGEKVIYERGLVELRKYKGAGSKISSSYGGVNLRVSKNVSFSVGGSDGNITPNPEEQTTIDVGTAIFTNQKILFAGPNHAREWDLDKLINLFAGDNGFEVDLAMSNRHKASTLAADSRKGITPGIMAVICVEMFQEGEEAARAETMKIVQDVRDKTAEYWSKNPKN